MIGADAHVVSYDGTVIIGSECAREKSHAKAAFDACNGSDKEQAALKKNWRKTTYRFKAYDPRVMGYLLEDPKTAFIPLLM